MPNASTAIKRIAMRGHRPADVRDVDREEAAAPEVSENDTDRHRDDERDEQRDRTDLDVLDEAVRHAFRRRSSGRRR